MVGDNKVNRFEDWIAFVFDHPVREPEWYWSADTEIARWTADPTRTVEWMTRLFREPEILALFTREQVGQGLWFLLGDGSPGEFGLHLYDRTIELDRRRECIRVTPAFFSDYVAVQCSRPTPVHHAGDTDDLETICFMWWDLWPERGLHRSSPDSDEIDTTVLEALSAIAALPSVACVESALHGLAHMHARNAQRTEEIVRSLLRQERGWPIELVRYAEAALRGTVQ